LLTRNVTCVEAQSGAVTHGTDTRQDGIQAVRQHWNRRVLRCQRNQGNMTVGTHCTWVNTNYRNI